MEARQTSKPSQTVKPMQLTDEDVNEALILLYRLSNEAVERINELMESLNVKFAEAALKSGVISQEELDAALDWVRQRAMMEGRSIVEDAMRRSVRQREIVLWKGPELVPSKQLTLAHRPDDPRSEMVRSLRTQLLLRMRGQRRAGVFALLSPCPGEGRSQLAAELAIAFAQLGRRTLLVDADLRRPAQHLLFGTENECGLAQALASKDAQRLYSICNLPQMALLTAGALPPNPVELLSGLAFERMVTDWSRNFEFVVLDTPPAGAYSDGLAVATVAGNVVVMGRAELTPFSALSQMCRDLETTHAQVLGAVINKF